MTQEAILGAGWFDEDTATFGDRLAGARDAAGLSQAELARRLGTKTKTIKGWENDQNEPRANKLQMVAGLLNVSIMWLLTGQGEGLDGPEMVESLPTGLEDMLTEMRKLRAEQAQIAEKMGRLEKRLRGALAETS
ncbi:helix-turn-helix domain-containing protein [Roseobacter sp. HKCCD9010]|uniref:helix-turn-helix domain-containing protein n=1 Tax=unclassified Roseobacter TaxID=196798 RepID=UPI001492D2E7|nr:MULTISPECIES: helix-turn-helix domain-containing protein [unclassified Roseobacter]MBF9049668.1 helix-turn-helix domain-containing protein [Rhodobacterales bacterium HKCCD4356]NNV11668.1 helix-turn-helix domain-containing protein [Roseobacter sp. HKCCD7357]NNV15852.1 helix-turn-helix domain-containing protein [Roseobacter sp. HKCCD8768]NNV25312.1 helix-turn-helix domain-containing protein [Roseobacter sp. HKCCD8192]NNV29569.1 helix-turn-helix domain-containing protein [Roseobacter sp. HKCCD